MNKIDELSLKTSEDVVQIMMELLSDLNLRQIPIHVKPEFLDNKIKTLLYCLSTTADAWYGRKAHPRTVLNAILVNTIQEYVEDSGYKIGDIGFWNNLTANVAEIYTNIVSETADPGKLTKIDIDSYHERFRRMLDVKAQ